MNFCCVGNTFLLILKSFIYFFWCSQKILIFCWQSKMFERSPIACFFNKLHCIKLQFSFIFVSGRFLIRLYSGGPDSRYFLTVCLPPFSPFFQGYKLISALPYSCWGFHSLRQYSDSSLSIFRRRPCFWIGLIGSVNGPSLSFSSAEIRRKCLACLFEIGAHFFCGAGAKFPVSWRRLFVERKCASPFDIVGSRIGEREF